MTSPGSGLQDGPVIKDDASQAASQPKGLQAINVCRHHGEHTDSINVCSQDPNALPDDAEGAHYTFRCQKCLNCPECSAFDNDRPKSLKEQQEQALIEKSITIDFSQKKAWARLPFTKPHSHLVKIWSSRRANTKEEPGSNRPQADKCLMKQLKLKPDQKSMVVKYWTGQMGQGPLQRQHQPAQGREAR